MCAVCRQTFRWEASLWLNGRQLYLGGFQTEEEAAHAYDLAALGCKGPTAEINFPVASYTAEMSNELNNLSQVWPSDHLPVSTDTFEERSSIHMFTLHVLFKVMSLWHAG